MKSRVWTAVLAVIILGAGFRLLWFYISAPAPGETVKHLMPVACAACGKVYAAQVGEEPTKCKYCGKRTAWRAQKCFNTKCGTIFPLVKDPATAREPGDRARCPKCGSTRTGEVPGNEVAKP